MDILNAINNVFIILDIRRFLFLRVYSSRDSFSSSFFFSLASGILHEKLIRTRVLLVVFVNRSQVLTQIRECHFNCAFQFFFGNYCLGSGENAEFLGTGLTSLPCGNRSTNRAFRLTDIYIYEIWNDVFEREYSS